MAADVKIDIAAEFTGKKAFKQADSATGKLTKNVKSLAKTFGLAFGTASVIAYGKASIKAAAADEKAQKQLANALKNVGMERDAIGAEGYIQRLQKEFGILDDQLRPAYQTLAIATKDAGETQKLLNVALDISAATGKDLQSVTGALSKAYLGNNTALSKLGVGISKADLKTKSFNEVVDQLSTTFAGSAKSAADSYEGSMNKLTVASNNAKEIIGTGLIDALKMLGDNDSVSNLAQDMEDVALYIADAIRGVGVLVEKIKSIPGANVLFDAFKTFQKTSALGVLNTLGANERQTPKPFNTAMTISGQVQIKQQKTLNKLTKDQAATQSKILKDKKLQQAIDKANIALLKGEEIFDMDKIQIAAALTSQAEQLGKATSSAQQLQIANDVARLNVKKSILELEDAIASKDQAAIEAATKKLNADLGVLYALTGQNAKLVDIKSILDSLQPKDLINLQNLQDAIDMIKKMLALLATASMASTAKIPTSSSLGSGIPVGDFIAPISKEVAKAGSIGALLEYADAATERANAFAMLQEQQNYADYLGLIDYQRTVGDLGGYSPYMNSGGSKTPVVNIYANTIANPDELVNLVQDSLIKLNRRGDSLVQAGSL